MKYLAIILGLVLMISCKEEGHSDDDFRPPHEEKMYKEERMSEQERDSVHEVRKKKMLDKLTEKLSLTEEQIRKIKAIDAEYHPQLRQLKDEMFQIRDKRRQLMKEKKQKLDAILTPEQTEKLEKLHKKSRGRDREFKKRKRHE